MPGSNVTATGWLCSSTQFDASFPLHATETSYSPSDTLSAMVNVSSKITPLPVMLQSPVQLMIPFLILTVNKPLPAASSTAPLFMPVSTRLGSEVIWNVNPANPALFQISTGTVTVAPATAVTAVGRIRKTLFPHTVQTPFTYACGSISVSASRYSSPQRLHLLSV